MSTLCDQLADINSKTADHLYIENTSPMRRTISRIAVAVGLSDHFLELLLSQLLGQAFDTGDHP